MWSLPTVFSCIRLHTVLLVWVSLCLSRNPETFHYQNMTTSIPWKTASLSSLMWVLREIQHIMKCSDPSALCSLSNHIPHYFSGCGTQEVSWWPQPAQHQLLLLPWRSWQRPWGDQEEHLGLPDWFYGEASRWCSNQQQTVPTQPPAEVRRGSVGTERRTIHVVRTTWLSPLGALGSAGSDESLSTVKP